MACWDDTTRMLHGCTGAARLPHAFRIRLSSQSDPMLRHDNCVQELFWNCA